MNRRSWYWGTKTPLCSWSQLFHCTSPTNFNFIIFAFHSQSVLHPRHSSLFFSWLGIFFSTYSVRSHNSYCYPHRSSPEERSLLGRSQRTRHFSCSTEGFEDQGQHLKWHTTEIGFCPAPGTNSFGNGRIFLRSSCSFSAEKLLFLKHQSSLWNKEWKMTSDTQQLLLKAFRVQEKPSCTGTMHGSCPIQTRAQPRALV